MGGFSDIAAFYREKSLVQASAGRQLIALLAIPPGAAILDVGCGTGNLTADLGRITSGRVVGVDPAAGMIRRSLDLYGAGGIDFRVMGAESLDYDGEFDILFCSSTFQWFNRPDAVLERFHRALRPGGRVGVQAPATSLFCPNFIRAIEHCRRTPRLDALYARFRSPWFFLESAEAYAELFSRAGFRVTHCRIEEERSCHTVDDAVDIFRSGAAAGFLGPDCFSVPLPEDFGPQVLQGVRESFAGEADSHGMVELLFHRLFVVAEKEGAG